MVCPNCKSTDIVAIQGHNYCLNCGQAVPGEAVKNPEPVTAAKQASRPASKPVVVKAVPAKPVPASSVASPQTRRKIEVETAVRVSTRPLPKAFVRHAEKHEATKADSQPAEVINKPVGAAVRPSAVVLPAQPHAHYTEPKHALRTIAIIVSLLLVAGCLAAVVVLSPGTLSQVADWIGGTGDSQPIALSLLGRWSVIVGASWLAYTTVTLVLIQSSYTNGRKRDGRPVSHKTSHSSALRTFWRVVEFDILSLPLWLGVGILEYLLVRYAGHLAPTATLTGYIIAAGSLPLGLAAAWLASGRNLGILRLSLTLDSGAAAALFSWKAIRREPIEVIAKTIISLMVLTISVLPSIVVGIWLRVGNLGSYTLWLGSLGWVLVTTVGVYFAMSHLVGSWIHLYSDLANIHHSAPNAKKPHHNLLDASFATAFVLLVFGMVSH